MGKSKVTGYRDLIVWNKAMDMVEGVYRVSARFPAGERYVLTSQIQRAAVSVPSNIAEGYGRANRGEYTHHLSIARGSLAELETQLMLAVRLEFVPREEVIEVWNLAQEVGKMLTSLILSLRVKGPATLSASSRPTPTSSPPSTRQTTSPMSSSASASPISSSP